MRRLVQRAGAKSKRGRLPAVCLLVSCHVPITNWLKAGIRRYLHLGKVSLATTMELLNTSTNVESQIWVLILRFCLVHQLLVADGLIVSLGHLSELKRHGLDMGSALVGDRHVGGALVVLVVLLSKEHWLNLPLLLGLVLYQRRVEVEHLLPNLPWYLQRLRHQTLVKNAKVRPTGVKLVHPRGRSEVSQWSAESLTHASSRLVTHEHRLVLFLPHLSLRK